MKIFNSKNGEYMVKDLDYKALEKELNKTEFAIVFIHAPWCQVCQAFKEQYEEIAFQNKDISFFKLNATNAGNEEYCQKVDFESVPYFAVHHNGMFIGGETGGDKQVVEAIIKMVRQFKERELQQLGA